MSTPKVPPPTPAGHMTPTEVDVPRIPSSVTLVDITSPFLAALDDTEDLGSLNSIQSLSGLSKLCKFERPDDGESAENWDNITDTGTGEKQQRQSVHFRDSSKKDLKEVKKVHGNVDISSRAE